jgi:hypothetical protein
MARPPKKSESLEIRIPYAEKTAFMDRCRADGVSASETLRGWIEAHLAGGAATNTRDGGRMRLRLAALAAALGLSAAALPSLARPPERAGFERLDHDGDGAVTAGELARLDRDRDGAVSFAEFRRR